MNVDPSNTSLISAPGKPHTSAYRLKKIQRLPEMTLGCAVSA